MRRGQLNVAVAIIRVLKKEGPLPVGIGVIYNVLNRGRGWTKKAIDGAMRELRDAGRIEKRPEGWVVVEQARGR